MKKITFLAIISGLILTACNDKNAINQNGSHSANEEAKRVYQIENPDKWYYVNTYKHDGCEYVVFEYGSKAWGGHKGNCSNPIHQHNQ
jgi:hypothetical protein